MPSPFQPIGDVVSEVRGRSVIFFFTGSKSVSVTVGLNGFVCLQNEERRRHEVNGLRSDANHQEMDEEEAEEDEEESKGDGDSRQTPDSSTAGDSGRTIPPSS